jgi:hypothetical protein
MPRTTNLSDDQLLITGNPEHSRALAKVFEEHYNKPVESAPKAEAEPRTFWFDGALHTKSEWEAWKRKRIGGWPGE